METSRSQELNRPALSVSHLAKAFGRLPVLSDVSFEVGRGELVCVLGPSGCGKTTLLRCIAGLTQWDSGAVAVNGQALRQKELSGQGLGVIFQEPRLLPWRTAAENVRLPFELRDGVSAADEEAVGRALALVGLAEFAASYPHQLSGGMKSRVALARALVMSPRTLLLDEPLTGLDLRTREELQDEIARIWAEAGMSLLWVTHDPEEAVSLADRIIVLSRRPAVVQGVVEVPLARPRAHQSEDARALTLEIRRLFA
jgi:ABC-type nitrate/sulfonate/bicarbonate transport system ATPase subunit